MSWLVTVAMQTATEATDAGSGLVALAATIKEYGLLPAFFMFLLYLAFMRAQRPASEGLASLKTAFREEMALVRESVDKVGEQVAQLRLESAERHTEQMLAQSKTNGKVSTLLERKAGGKHG